MLRRILWSCKSLDKEVAYKSLIPPHLEYACAVWDPYHLKDIHELKMVQRRAARFVCKDYRREDGVVIGLLSKLEWPILQERRA